MRRNATRPVPQTEPNRSGLLAGQTAMRLDVLSQGGVYVGLVFATLGFEPLQLHDKIVVTVDDIGKSARGPISSRSGLDSPVHIIAKG